MIHSRPTALTPDVEQVLNAHHQLWDRNATITYKDQTMSSYVPSHDGYCSVVLNSAGGVPHLWVTQNMNKATYGSYAINQAHAKGERLRITWIVYTGQGSYRYAGQIQTHEYFDPAKPDRIHIETYHRDEYDKDVVNVIYTTHSTYSEVSPYT